MADNYIDSLSRIRSILRGISDEGKLMFFGHACPSETAAGRLRREISAIAQTGHKLSLIMIGLNNGSGVSYRSQEIMCYQSTIKAIYIGSLLDERPELFEKEQEMIRKTIELSDNETYAYYEESLQAIANAFKNSTYASSARIPSESDFTTIRNNSLTILNKYPLTRKNSESRSWTGNQEGGANYYYYIYYANNTTTTQFIIWEKYAGTGGQSSTSHSIGLEIRPIVRIKADIYENGGNGSSSSPWKMTTL